MESSMQNLIVAFVAIMIAFMIFAGLMVCAIAEYVRAAASEGAKSAGEWKLEQLYKKAESLYSKLESIEEDISDLKIESEGE